MMNYGLIGHNIAYSLSPVIHEMISQSPINYKIIDISPEELKTGIPDILHELSGFNVTIPHKQHIMQYCKKLHPAAEKIGAVNTVNIVHGEWYGYNTDYLGFISTLKANIPNYFNYHPVIIGYGGVARAVLFALAEMGFRYISIFGGEIEAERKVFINEVSRTIDMDLIEFIPPIPKLWINCTPVGGVKIPKVPEGFIDISVKDYLYDLNYTPYPTHLEIFAKKKGAKTMNGLKMLVSQAVEAQNIWFAGERRKEVDINSIIHSIVNLINVT